MAAIAIDPLFLTEADLLIDADDFAAHISGAQIVPASSTQTWKGLKKTAVFSAGTAPTWTMTLNLAQDWKSAKSLSQYLLDHQGEEKEITLKPISGGLGFKVVAIIQPGPIGGDVDTFAASSVSLGLKGAPVKVPAPAPKPAA